MFYQPSDETSPSTQELLHTLPIPDHWSSPCLNQSIDGGKIASLGGPVFNMFYWPNDEISSPSTQKLHTLPIPDNWSSPCLNQSIDGG